MLPYEIKLRNKMNTAFIARETARLIEEKVKVHQLGPNQNALDELLIENEADIEDIPLNVRKLLKFVLLDHAKEALQYALAE